VLYNTEGIVIKSIAYGETHAILTLLTPMGIVAVMARGAKKPQSKLRAGSTLCAKGIFSIYRRRGMGNLEQVEIVQSHRLFQEHLELAAYAAYFCELAGAAAVDPSIGNHAFYRLFDTLLERLHQNAADGEILARIWETKILCILGAAPDWGNCVTCGQVLSRTYFYSPENGGFICESCSAKLSLQYKKLLKAPPQVAHVLQQFVRVPFDRLGHVSLSEATRKCIKLVLSNQLFEFAGMSLKSRAVLESLAIEDIALGINPDQTEKY
jgi:DNA repair protein RecO (recombination protein O)